ncbi:MAG: type III pantothenate kinase [Deltaproteobacteria bacterium]|nr:type III pantothenate kinase [Deltaproteobacteria bacterium]
MLLAVDIGNTNTVIGLYQGKTLAHHFRIESAKGRTVDEYSALLISLFAMKRVDPKSIVDGIVASVVPPLTETLVEAMKEAIGHAPRVVGPGTRTGMPILYENPREVGADRIVNAVAAYERFHAGVIVVDFGTATTFDVVSDKGEYMGGAIAPGIAISADALFRLAAKLPRIEIVRPKHAIGRNTVASMQAGLVFGYVGLVDGMVERIRAEVSFPMHVIATGGLARLLAPESRTIEDVDDWLTLDGLRILHERNA